MVNIGKKLEQFKQWTGESIGIIDRTEITKDLKYVEAEMISRLKCMEHMKKSLEAVISCLDLQRKPCLGMPIGKKSLPIEQLGVDMLAYSSLLRDDGEATSATMVDIIANCQRGLGAAQSNFVISIKNNLLRKLIQIEQVIHEYRKLRKKLNGRRLTMDSVANKNRMENTSSPQYLEALHKYKETLGEVQRIIGDFMDKSKDVHKELYDFYMEQLEMYKKSYHILTEHKVEYAVNTSIGIDTSGKDKSTNPPTTHNPSLPPKVEVNMNKLKKGSILVASYPFTARSKDELSLSKGEKVKIIDTSDSSWWLGENKNGKQGLFPSNYVKDQ